MLETTHERSPVRVVAAAILGILAVATIALSSKIYENVAADEIIVIQAPFSGNLTWYTTPGMVWQGFGEVTTYKKRATYNFEEQGYESRFNDGGHGTIKGSIQYELPLSPDQLTAMHVKYRNMDTLQQDLIVKATNASLYLVGTLMSSKESYAEKRNDLIHYVTDQTQHGIYRTRQKTEWIIDPVTKENKQITTAEILKDKDGNPERQEVSAIDHYGIKVSLFTINKLPYDKIVEEQIQQQQKIAMAVQTSAAEATMAEQRARTVEQQGRANATEAKWAQETIKARVVTEADQQKIVAVTNAERDKAVAETQANQRLTVADLDRRASEQKKLEQILLGEGEAERKKLVLAADGALEQKLAAYIRVQGSWAEALRGTTMTPSVVMGGSGQNVAGAGAQDFISLLAVKAAKDLSLDMTIPNGGVVRAQK